MAKKATPAKKKPLTTKKSAVKVIESKPGKKTLKATVTTMANAAKNIVQPKKSATNKLFKKSTGKKSPKDHSRVALTPEIVDQDEPKTLEPDFDLDPAGDPLESTEIPQLEGSTSTALTSSSTDPVARYLAEIRKYPLLSKEEEHKLAVQYFDTKDPQMAQKLVTSNLRFVVKIAAEYAKFGARLIDLVQEGNVGLMHAVKEYNPYKGARLITYAVWWIRGYIQEYLMRQYSMVRIGTTQTQRKLFYQLQREREQLERMGMQQGIAQLSGRLGIPEKEVQEMSQRVLGRDVSLSQPVGENDNSTMMDFQSHEDQGSVEDQLGHAEELKMLTDKIAEIRDDLTEREIFVLDNRLLSDEPMTLQEIGDKYGITREAARQMEARLMNKIKAELLPKEEDN